MTEDGERPGCEPATGPARRAVLTASAVALPLLLTACKGLQALGTPPPPPADVDTLRSAITAEAVLIARYEAATGPGAPAAGTRLAASLTAVLADHRQHLAQLRSRLVEPAGQRASAAPRPVSPGRPVPTIGQLEQAEQAASDRLIGQLDGLPPSLAQLFASIAASEATHVPYLTAARLGR